MVEVDAVAWGELSDGVEAVEGEEEDEKGEVAESVWSGVEFCSAVGTGGFE